MFKNMHISTLAFLNFVVMIAVNMSMSDSLAQDREWLDADFEKKWSVEPSQLYRPAGSFYVDDSHQLYILDTGDFTIKMFDAEGNFVRAFGKEKGAGPGEVRHPIGFDLDRDGKIWIADPGNSRIAVFQNDGTFLKHVSLGVTPYRIAVQNEAEFFYIINQGAVSGGKFTLVSGNGETSRQFGSGIIENQIVNNIVLSGEITVGSNGNLYYTPMYAGLIMGFDSGGNELFKTNEVIPTPFPEVMFDEQGGRWIDRDAPPVSHGIFFTDDARIAVLSTAASPQARQAIDFYNQETGEYLYSMKLPKVAQQAYLKDDILYIVWYTDELEPVISAWAVISKVY